MPSLSPIRHTPNETPPDGATVRYGFQFPYSGVKEFIGVVKDGAIYSTNGKTRMTRLASRWLLWWEEA